MQEEFSTFIKFNSLDTKFGAKQLNQQGLIVYEYNPLKVLLKDNEGISDLTTDKLKFDLNHPVDIITQPSYDGTVNLILNDGTHTPKLINSRFTTTGKNTYKIVDRNGDSDSNIYDEETFELKTSLFKLNSNIVKVDFLGFLESGYLGVGNYHFYFKLKDADGNETDFVAESGVISCYIGNQYDLSSIRGGVEDESAHKTINLKLSNLNTSYKSVSVYYTRATGSYEGTEYINAFKLNYDYVIVNGVSNISINGGEPVIPISIDELNVYYHTLDSAATQAENSNMLFLGNTKDTIIDYKELTDLSLRICPKLYNGEDIGYVDSNYVDNSGSQNPNEYYNPLNIYYRLGYWDDEIYRFGVVYIYNNGDISPVFNVRGIHELSMGTEYTDIPVWEEGHRKYIEIDEFTHIIGINENSKGVVKIKYEDTFKENKIKPCGIRFSMNENVVEELKNLGISGAFFVRQKRMKTTLCQAIPIGLDNNSCLPLLPLEDNKYLYESFLTENRKLVHSFGARKKVIASTNVKEGYAALCPEYELNQGFFNNYFTGSKLIFNKKYNISKKFESSNDEKHFVLDPKNYSYQDSNVYFNVNVIGVCDGTKWISNKNQMYSAMAGMSSDATSFSYMESELKLETATNLCRGMFGSYIGTESYTLSDFGIYNIKIPGYDPNIDLFSFRYRDQSQFFAISERFDFDEFSHSRDKYTSPPVYRGDCFIGNFSHRMIRNFQDPEAPTNDTIIQADTWYEHYKLGKDDSLEERLKINRGDVNAVKIGHWATFKVCSNYNISLRSHDNSRPSEFGLTGHHRTFYPFSGLDVSGTAKIPESQVRNAGYDKTVSEQYRINQPTVPTLENTYHTRIYYSDISTEGAFENGYRIFRNANFRDYPLQYGALIKMCSWGTNIIAIFEHGILRLPINEKASIASTQGDTSFLQATSVLPETPEVLSDMYGTQWADSVIQTPYAIYGVDTVAKKIWRIAIAGSLQRRYTVSVISDFKLQKFLNDNITLSEQELIPIIGIRNVKSHYNAFKNDVMFTFYDDLNSTEEKAWNLCYNETLDKFITFYSWVPSYSENVDNVFFTFDRDSSKRIAHIDNFNSKQLTLHNLENEEVTQIDVKDIEENKILLGTLSFNLDIYDDSLITSSLSGLKDDIKFELLDNVNRAMFEIDGSNLYLIKGIYNNFKKSGRFEKELITVPIKVQANISSSSGQSINTYTANLYLVDYSYDKNLEKTYFWKHGQAGLMETKSDIKPCLWYGKQHPFEFEFIVVNNAQLHKIFTNLSIISNKVAPESLHFEIDGEVYNFADDKKNMFFRQEALKHLYQYNGVDISYDKNYLSLKPEQRDIYGSEYKDKSTAFPIYYGRVDTINEIEDFYQSKSDYNMDYQRMSGSEIVYDKTMNQFRIATHIKGCPFGGQYKQHDTGEVKTYGRSNGNMHYKEGIWNVQIPSIVYWQKNEKPWIYPPLNIVNNPTPNYEPISVIGIPQKLSELGYINGDGSENILFDTSIWENRKETRIRDKYLKVKIRYTGDDLAVIYAIKTLFTISYG